MFASMFGLCPLIETAGPISQPDQCYSRTNVLPLERFGGRCTLVGACCPHAPVDISFSYFSPLRCMKVTAIVDYLKCYFPVEPGDLVLT
eukprot:scaffold245384_cov18-Tisochrysis_lutea.AAC.1